MPLIDRQHCKTTSRTGLRLVAAALSVLFLGLGSGCNNANLQTNCPGGNCGCTADGGCATGQTCNQSGFCQAQAGCQTSLDCAKGTICDTTTGNCIDAKHCTEDIQCALGEVCDRVRYQCVPGCYEVGDCQFGDVCQCPAGATCTTGQILDCVTGPCGDNSYCQYGQECLGETDGGPKSCVADTRGPFCQPCTVGAGQMLCAGTDPNFCLVDTSKNFAADFCGVDCSKGQSCPQGFECSDVLILTEQTCGSSGMQCPLRPAPVCNSDMDCANQRGGACDKTKHVCVCVTDADCPGGQCEPVSGQCRSTCEVGEGQQQGFCTCLEDSDCPLDTCNSQDQRCAISLAECDPTNPSSCAPIFCKKVTDPLSMAVTGYCFIGQNCAPVNGVTCDQVLNAQ